MRDAGNIEVTAAGKRRGKGKKELKEKKAPDLPLYWQKTAKESLFPHARQ